MIHFVLHDARLHVVEFAFLCLPLRVHVLHDNGERTGYLQPDAGKAEASFFHDIGFLAPLRDVRIDERREASVDLRDADAQALADLGRGDAESVGFHRRLFHVLQKLQDLFRHGDFLRFCAEDGLVGACDDRERCDGVIVPEMNQEVRIMN